MFTTYLSAISRVNEFLDTGFMKVLFQGGRTRTVLLEIQQRCFSVSPLTAAAAQVRIHPQNPVFPSFSVTKVYCYVISV